MGALNRTRGTVATVLAALLATAALPAAGTAQEGACANVDVDVRTLQDTAVEKALRCELNRRRAARDLPPLASHPKLRKAARSFVRDLARAGRLDHRLGGRTPAARAKAAGYRWPKTVVENIAFGHFTVTAVVDEWTDDHAHRRNVLIRRRDVGLAYLDGYWVQMAGRTAKAKGRR